MAGDDPFAKARIEAGLRIGAPCTRAPLFRQIASAAAIIAVKEAGARPAGTGDGVQDCAPARGPAQLFRPEELVRTASGNLAYRRMTAPGAAALRLADAFDVMQEQAARRARSRGSDVPPLFDPAQIEAGRAYGRLFERVDAGGVRGSSIEVLSSASPGSGGSFIDAYCADAARLRRMQAAIGDGWALEPRAAAHHADRRRAIRVRAVVHLVAVGGETLSDVLVRYGWTPQTKQRETLRAALVLALDRLYGL